MNTVDLSIIVVSYNTKTLLEKCLASIAQNKGNLKIETIVVDNGSQDGSVEYLKTQSRRGGTNLKLIFNKKNSGFAKANNQGIKIAKGRYVMLLNSDAVIKKGSLGAMIRFVKKHPDVSVVGARLLNKDGSVQPSCYHFPSLWRAIAEFWFEAEGMFSKYAPRGEKPAKVDSVVGAAFLISKKTIKKVGFLDERLFMYFEDLDYCRRTWQSGLKVYYLPEAEIIHLHGASGQKVKGKIDKWLKESSKIYNGALRYYLLTAIIFFGQRWQRLKDYFWQR